MGYYWCYGNDNAIAVTTGAAGVNFVGVIQRPDSSGGYNVNFSVPNSLAVYHVHFRRGGKRVAVVRYKASTTAEGNNIVRYDSGVTKTLGQLAHAASAYPNHAALLTNLKNAVAGAETLANGELA